MGTSILLKSIFIIAAISVIATFTSALTVEAQVNPLITWTGDGENNLWSNPDNWDKPFSPTQSTANSRIIIPSAFDDPAKGNVEVVMDISQFVIKDGGRFTNNGNLTISKNSVLIVEPNRINLGGPTPDITVFLNQGLLTNLGKIVIKDQFDNYLVMINKGTIEIGGRITFEGTPQEGILRNYFEFNNFGGQITNDGKLHGIGLMFFNNGTITNNGELRNGDTATAIGEVGWQIIKELVIEKAKVKAAGKILPALDKILNHPRTPGPTIQNEGTINNNGVFTNQWNVEFGNAVNSFLADIKKSVAFVPSGLIEVPEFPTPTIIDNRGTINISQSTLDNGSVIKNSGTINVGDGGTLLNNEVTVGSIPAFAKGTIQNSGTINSLSSSSKIVNKGNFEITGVLLNGGGFTQTTILRDTTTKEIITLTVDHHPSFENRDTITITGDGILNNQGVLSNFHKILIQNGGTFNNLDYGVLVAVDFLTKVTVERDSILFNLGTIQLGINNSIFGAGPIGQIHVVDGFFLNSGIIKKPGGLHVTIGQDTVRGQTDSRRGGTGISYCTFSDDDAVDTHGTGTYNRDSSCTMTFTGAGGDQKWSNPLNWDGKRIGAAGGNIRISSTAHMNQDVFLTTGTITTNPGSHLIVDPGNRFAIAWPEIVFTNNGAFTVSPLALFDSIGTTDNNGVVTNKGNMIISNKFNNPGTLVNNIQGFRAEDGRFLFQVPAGEDSDDFEVLPARIFNQGEISSSGTITNHGELVNENRIINTNTFDNDGFFLNRGDGRVENSGTITNHFPEVFHDFECNQFNEDCDFGASEILNRANIYNTGTIHNDKFATISNLDGARIWNSPSFADGSGLIINESHIKNEGPGSSIVQRIINIPKLFSGDIINDCGNVLSSVIEGKPISTIPCIFLGGGGDNLWSNVNNWNNKNLPFNNDVEILAPVHLDIKTPPNSFSSVQFINNKIDIRSSLTMDPGSSISLDDSTIKVWGSGELINKGKIKAFGKSKIFPDGLFENHCGGLLLGTLEFVRLDLTNFVKIPCVWDGGGDGASWHDANNWKTDKLPGAGDIIIIDGDDSKSSTVNGIGFPLTELYLGGKIIIDEGDT